MTPLVSQLWPQFMADPDFAASFGRVIVEHARMLRQERQVVFTLRSAAPLDKGLCARLLASLQPDYEGFELKIDNLFGYAALDEAALRELMEEMKRDGIPINGFLDRCRITITGQNITVGVCHGTKFLQEMEFERLLAERVAAHTGVRPKVTLTSAVGEAEQRQMEEKLERKIAPPVVKFEKKNTAPSIKVEGLDLTDKPVTIFPRQDVHPQEPHPPQGPGRRGRQVRDLGRRVLYRGQGQLPQDLHGVHHRLHRLHQPEDPRAGRGGLLQVGEHRQGHHPAGARRLHLRQVRARLHRLPLRCPVRGAEKAGGQRPGKAGGASPAYQAVQHGCLLRPGRHRQAGPPDGPPCHCHHRPRCLSGLPGGHAGHRRDPQERPGVQADLRLRGLLCG